MQNRRFALQIIGIFFPSSLFSKDSFWSHRQDLMPSLFLRTMYLLHMSSWSTNFLIVIVAVMKSWMYNRYCSPIFFWCLKHRAYARSTDEYTEFIPLPVWIFSLHRDLQEIYTYEMVELIHSVQETEKVGFSSMLTLFLAWIKVTLYLHF